MPEDRLTEILREAFEAGRLAAYFDRVQPPQTHRTGKGTVAKPAPLTRPETDEWHH